MTDQELLLQLLRRQRIRKERLITLTAKKLPQPIIDNEIRLIAEGEQEIAALEAKIKNEGHDNL
jgi:hypothetical protein